MKTRFSTVLLSILLLFGVYLNAFGQSTTNENFHGIWAASESGFIYQYIFIGDRWVFSADGIPIAKGTYNTTTRQIVLVIDAEYIGEWYYSSDMITYNYTFSGDYLTLQAPEERIVLKKL